MLDAEIISIEEARRIYRTERPNTFRDPVDFICHECQAVMPKVSGAFFNPGHICIRETGWKPMSDVIGVDWGRQPSSSAFSEVKVSKKFTPLPMSEIIFDDVDEADIDPGSPAARFLDEIWDNITRNRSR